MIVLYILFLLVVLMVAIFIGLQISTSIEDSTLYALFWIVYLIICMSIGNGVAITYFWNIIQKKAGPPGPRGPEGDAGKTGLKGKCQSTCSVKTCSINLRKVIEDELAILNGGQPVKVVNQMMLYKLDQMCNSKDYEIVAPMKGPNNILDYMTEKWKIWVKLLYDAGGVNFFTDESAEDDYAWRDGINPFDEITKYDLWNWGLTREFEPLAIEICNDPSKSNEFPKEYKSRFKYIYTNDYRWELDDAGSRAKQDLSIWYPKRAVFENERYYPVGFVAVGPRRWGESGTAPKFVGESRVTRGGGGPDKSTILVTGDVKPPIDYIWKWNSWGSRMPWFSTMWTPIPPPGYVCLGDVMTKGWGKPPTNDNAPIRCIPARYVQAIPNSGNVLIWNDRGSGADNDGSIFGMNNGAYGEGTPANGYNCFRCVIGYPGTMGNGSFPLYRILDNKLNPKNASTKEIDSRYENQGMGWHGSPSREPKYSIFTFLGLIPEGIINAKSSSRKYYIIHSGDYYHNDEKNTQIPMNTYLVLHWNEKTNDFTTALTATGTNSVILLPKTRIDIRQQWEVVFVENSDNEFKLKSRDSGLYLYDKPKDNLRGTDSYFQVKETDLADPEIAKYVVFIDSKSAFGTPLNRIKQPVGVEGEEIKVEYTDISRKPMPTRYPDRFIKTMVAGEKDPLPPSPRLSSRLSKKTPGSSTAAKVVTGLVVGAVAGAVVGTVISKSIGNNKKKTDEKKKKKKKK